MYKEKKKGECRGVSDTGVWSYAFESWQEYVSSIATLATLGAVGLVVCVAVNYKQC